MPRRSAKAKLLSDGQAFLAGPNYYLRGVGKDDWKSANAWWPARFPMGMDAGEELITEALRSERSGGGAQTFVVRKRGDDTPVGSLRFWYSELNWGMLRPHINPVIDDAEGARITAEVLALAVPWALDEWGANSVSVEFDGSLPGLQDSLENLGMRFSYRLREALLFRGERCDLLSYEGLSRSALEQFGKPEPPTEGAVRRETRHPAGPPIVGNASSLPDRTMLASERLILRPVEKDDVPILEDARMRETETFHDYRWPASTLLMAEGFRNMAKEPLPQFVFFAIERRSDGKLLGINGIMEIDWIHRTAETATELVWPEVRGSGYGSEAKHLLLDYTFSTLGLHMVRSFVWGPNTRSAAALRKQGYRDAGFISWRNMYRGQPCGDWAFDLLASEWFNARAAPVKPGRKRAAK